MRANQRQLNNNYTKQFRLSDASVNMDTLGSSDVREDDRIDANGNAIEMCRRSEGVESEGSRFSQRATIVLGGKSDSFAIEIGKPNLSEVSNPDFRQSEMDEVDDTKDSQESAFNHSLHGSNTFLTIFIFINV